MAFLWKKPNSIYWQAGFIGGDGKRRNRSTKVEAKSTNRREAQRIANAYEDAGRKSRTAKQVHSVISDLHREITGGNLPTSTVRKFGETFQNRKKGETGKATQAFYASTINGLLAWLGSRADSDLNEISPDDISNFRNHLASKVSETTITNKIKAIRAMFTAAQKEGLCLIEPTENLKLTRKASKGGRSSGRRPFTLAELQKIKLESTGEWKSMLIFGIYTGQRLGDLATLKWSDINLSADELSLSTRKTGRKVVIPFSSPLKEHVSELSKSPDDEILVHPNLAKAYERNGSATLSNQFNTILANCEIRKPVSHRSKRSGRDSTREECKVSFHSLRATAVTLMHEAGIPPATVEEWVGHDSAEVHRVYVKIGRESLIAASNALPRI